MNDFNWQSKPSQLINIGKYTFVTIIAVLVFVSFNELFSGTSYEIKQYFYLALIFGWLTVCLVIFLKTATINYRINSARFVEEYGILSKVMESVELFRIKDVTVLKPFHIRIFGLSSIRIDSSDKTAPTVFVLGVADGEHLSEALKEVVSKERKRLGVREFD